MRSITSWLIALILVLSLVVTLVTDRLSARQHATELASMSAFEMAMESRTTAPAEPGNSSAFWLGVAIVAVLVLVGVGLVATLGNGGEFLRQLRLNRKRQERPRPSLTISNPQQPDYPQLPTVPRLRQLPPVEEGYYQE